MAKCRRTIWGNFPTVHWPLSSQKRRRVENKQGRTELRLVRRPPSPSGSGLPTWRPPTRPRRRRKERRRRSRRPRRPRPRRRRRRRRRRLLLSRPSRRPPAAPPCTSSPRRRPQRPRSDTFRSRHLIYLSNLQIGP